MSTEKGKIYKITNKENGLIYIGLMNIFIDVLKQIISQNYTTQ